MRVNLRRKDTFWIGAVIVLITAAAWAGTIYQSVTMNGMVGTMTDGMGTAPAAGSVILFLTVWLVMMTAMMLPSAAPMIMTFASLTRDSQSHHATFVPTTVFLLGYLVVWTGLGALAYGLSQSLSYLVMILPNIGSYATLAGGAVLILAGAFQLSSWKYICLSKCRTPLGFIVTNWRAGSRGAWQLGVKHGLYCVGCCWALMAILTIVGVMNLAAMALLTLVIFLEKVSVRGVLVGKIVGVLLLMTGLAFLGHSLLPS